MTWRASLQRAVRRQTHALLLLCVAASTASAAARELIVERIGSLTHARAAHGAAQLSDGRVLVAGGSAYHLAVHVVEAELVDPVTGRSQPAGELLLPRCLPTVVARPEGGAFVLAGSRISYYRPIRLVEAWSPSERFFTAHSELLEPRSIGLRAEVLPDGDLLVIGGTVDGGSGQATDAVERVSASGGPARLVGRLALPRAGFAAARLDDARWLLVGGNFRCCGHPLDERLHSAAEVLRLDGERTASKVHRIPALPHADGLDLLRLSPERLLARHESEGLCHLRVSSSAVEWLPLPSADAAEVRTGTLVPLGEGAVVAVSGDAGYQVHDARTGERLAELTAGTLPAAAVWTPLADGCVLITGGREPNGAAVDGIWRACLEDAAP